MSVKMSKDELGQRMKTYERQSTVSLKNKQPVIIRLDGKAFHTFTRGFRKPFDEILNTCMRETAKYLCQNIMGCKFAYTQSDEISLLLVDYEREESQSWFDYKVQKLVSVSASMATMKFNAVFTSLLAKGPELTKDFLDGDEKFSAEFTEYWSMLQQKVGTAMFDSRCFNLPKDEVCNYFIWRQQDAIRNSVQMVAQSLFSQKKLQNKSCKELKEMMLQEFGVDWENCSTAYKRGIGVNKESFFVNSDTERHVWTIDFDIPIFTQDREYINRYVYFS